METIEEYIYKHPFALIINNKDEKWYSLRPCGKNRYWIENNEGEGTEIEQDELFKIIDEFFKKVF